MMYFITQGKYPASQLYKVYEFYAKLIVFVCGWIRKKQTCTRKYMCNQLSITRTSLL